MKRRIYNVLKRVINVKDSVLSGCLSSQQNVVHQGLKMKFATPNSLCRYRAKSFSTKEPDTLAWIDALENGKVFWDIGANVGVYTLYVAMKKDARVWAFEPSLFNLEMLARNINLNNLQDKVNIVPIALNNKNGFNSMTHSTTDWGGALSAFEQSYGYEGKELRNVFSYRTLGLTLDFLVQTLAIPLPDYIKIDVDGIEHLILEGGEKSLVNVKEILVELNEDFEEQHERAVSLLRESGFYLGNKGPYHHPSIRISNQIWVRSNLS